MTEEKEYYVRAKVTHTFRAGVTVTAKSQEEAEAIAADKVKTEFDEWEMGHEETEDWDTEHLSTEEDA
jgi:uncharacterized membrane protein YkoI